MDVPLSDSPMNKEKPTGICWGSSCPGAHGWSFSGSSKISVGLWGSRLGSCAASAARCSGGGSFPGASALCGVHLAKGF